MGGRGIGIQTGFSSSGFYGTFLGSTDFGSYNGGGPIFEIEGGGTWFPGFPGGCSGLGGSTALIGTGSSGFFNGL